jgi:hypothetical protein
MPHDHAPDSYVNLTPLALGPLQQPQDLAERVAARFVLTIARLVLEGSTEITKFMLGVALLDGVGR